MERPPPGEADPAATGSASERSSLLTFAIRVDWRHAALWQILRPFGAFWQIREAAVQVAAREKTLETHSLRRRGARGLKRAQLRRFARAIRSPALHRAPATRLASLPKVWKARSYSSQADSSAGRSGGRRPSWSRSQRAAPCEYARTRVPADALYQAGRRLALDDRRDEVVALALRLAEGLTIANSCRRSTAVANLFFLP